MTRFLTRMVGFARFDTDIYEDVEADTHATVQALVVVLLACLGAAIGWSGAGPRQGSALLLLTAVAVAGWVVWAVLTYLIGTRLLAEPQTQADIGQLLRTLGFAQSPGVLQMFGVIPGVNPLGVTLLLSVWWLCTTVVAVRQALDLTTTARAFAVCITGWILALIMFFVIGVAYAPPVS